MKTALLIFIFSLLLFSCRKYNQNCDTSISPSLNCNTTPITEGDVTIRLSYLNGSEGIPVALYLGNIEDEYIIWYDTVYTDKITFTLPNQQNYSAEAYYQIGNQWLVALDGKRLKQKKRDECEYTCYLESNITLDLRQK
jgi:hypothetical protein